jgi:peptidoglycan glycosyltransferase
MKKRAQRRSGTFLLFSALALTAVLAGGSYLVSRLIKGESVAKIFTPKPSVTKKAIASALGEAGKFQEFPSEIELPIDGTHSKVIVQYAFDPDLQNSMQKLFSTYHPDYGAFVAMDASTGQILSMVSYSGNGTKADALGNLTLRATFPSASVFKVVTAAAAIEEHKLSADSVIPYNGRNHTLYRSNVFSDRVTRWTRYITLKEAFARSINTVFGKIGARSLSAEDLRKYATKFGFNRTIVADLPVGEGKAVIEDDPWAVAEAASGYTKENTMSPLQGAMIAAAIANGGQMMEPFAVSSIHTQNGEILYSAQPNVASVTVDKPTAEQIRDLMRATIKKGTSRRSFNGFFKGRFSFVDVGGKTGSLTGTDPKGKYDWFVGYADDGSHKIAVAALSISLKYWRVKSSYVARRAFEQYFRKKLASEIALR